MPTRCRADVRSRAERCPRRPRCRRCRSGSGSDHARREGAGRCADDGARAAGGTAVGRLPGHRFSRFRWQAGRTAVAFARHNGRRRDLDFLSTQHAPMEPAFEPTSLRCRASSRRRHLSISHRPVAKAEPEPEPEPCLCPSDAPIVKSRARAVGLSRWSHDQREPEPSRGRGCSRAGRRARHGAQPLPNPSPSPRRASRRTERKSSPSPSPNWSPKRRPSPKPTSCRKPS